MECRKETWGYFHDGLNVHGVDGGIVEFVGDDEGDAVFDGLGKQELVNGETVFPLSLGCCLKHGSEDFFSQYLTDWWIEFTELGELANLDFFEGFGSGSLGVIFIFLAQEGPCFRLCGFFVIFH